MSTTQGFVHDGFENVKTVFDANFATGADIGASYCVTRNGETVVDLWGGYGDAAPTRP